VDGVGAAEGRGADFTETNVADFAFGNELRHASHGVLNWNLGVDSLWC
jgi:hypothetical protein